MMFEKSRDAGAQVGISLTCGIEKTFPFLRIQLDRVEKELFETSV